MINGVIDSFDGIIDGVSWVWWDYDGLMGLFDRIDGFDGIIDRLQAVLVGLMGLLIVLM